MKTTILIATLTFAAACHSQHEQHHPSKAATATVAPVAAQETNGVQTVDLKISGGEYQPASFTVRSGMPVRLNVTRDDKPGCGDTLVIPSQNISKEIPVNQVTTIDFTPAQPGDLEFTCGMNMMRGKIVVQRAGA
ncbi:MAG TPA: cupredoxin domain-containing protein [Thermoanaerobaculia bacterium]